MTSFFKNFIYFTLFILLKHSILALAHSTCLIFHSLLKFSYLLFLLFIRSMIREHNEMSYDFIFKEKNVKNVITII